VVNVLVALEEERSVEMEELGVLSSMVGMLVVVECQQILAYRGYEFFEVA